MSRAVGAVPGSRSTRRAGARSDASAVLPDGPLLAWYGDDFTGAAAVMEVLSFAGFPSVLFLDPPDAARLARVGTMRGIGVAGTARSRTPAWMEAHLPRAFDALARSGAPLLHYKVCSTLDSSPEVGSIGRAIELALARIPSAWVPVLVAAPPLRRYQAFGQLFAAAGESVHRLDRHPVMARHPSTPMDEADVLAHLARQTDLPGRLIDLEALAGSDDPSVPHAKSARAILASVAAAEPPGGGAPLVSFDAIDASSLEAVGRLIWEHRGERLLAVGSQGIEYALVSHWRRLGLGGSGDAHARESDGARAATPDARACVGPVERLLTLSGSVSSITAAQLEHALARGACPVAIPPELAFVDPAAREHLIEALSARALEALTRDQDPLLFTALGPADPAVQRFGERREAAGLSAVDAAERLGGALGTLTRRLLERSGLRRVAVCGGDTSGHALQALDIYALTALAPLVPGAALLQAHSERSAPDGLQLSLKGGQMGPENFLEQVKRGGHVAHDPHRGLSAPDRMMNR